MKLILDDEQAMLATTAREWALKSSPLSRLRRLRDEGDVLAFSPEVWRQIAELGWTGIPFEEEDGGLGLGLAEVVVVTEALGRVLAPEPFISTVMLGGMALSLAGTAEQKERFLTPLIAGKCHLALAYQERSSRFDVTPGATRAQSTSDGYVVDGEKTHVLGATAADAFIVAARAPAESAAAGGSMLFVIPRNTPGLTVVPQRRVDSLNAGVVRLQGVNVARDATLGGERSGDILPRVIDGATVALCGEMLGGMTEAFDRTIAYMKERVQFDTVIGSFQALKHRAARLFIEIELTRSAVMAAARALDEKAPGADRLVSVAKARASDAYMLVASEAVQLHGGIGMTDEHDIGFFLKRARGAEMTFGDAAFHRERYARLCAF